MHWNPIPGTVWLTLPLLVSGLLGLSGCGTGGTADTGSSAAPPGGSVTLWTDST